jgi:hypothetical protein
MRLIIFVLLLPVFLSCSAPAVLKAKVLETEKQRFTALVTKDYNTLDKTISNDLVYIHSNGSTDTKTSFIESIKDGSRSYDDIKIEKADVRIYHGKTGIINGECTYFRKTKEGGDNNLLLRYTSVYIKQKKHWQQVSWQSFKRN